MWVKDRKTQYFLLAIAVLVMLTATAVAYYPGLHGPFMFDDNPNIVGNPALRIDSLAPHELLRAAFSSRSGILYRPISMLSFALNVYFLGESSFPFKLVNLIIHLVNTLLMLWLTRKLLMNCKRRYQFDWSDTTLTWTSVLIAASWALHPLNLTSVLYIIQRMTSLAALFTLAGILTYVYGRERTLAGKTGWPLAWLLTPLFGVIGMLCKEDAALLPVYLLIIEWLIFGFRNARRAIAKNILAFYLCSLVLPGIVGLVYLFSHGWIFGGYTGRNFTLSERLLTEFRVVFLYIKWTFIPNIRNLALYHDDIAVSTGLLTPLTTLWSLLALVAFAVLAWFQRKRRPLFCLGIFIFFAGQLMESTVLPLEIAFEHRNYLPDYGLLLAVFSLLFLPVASRKRYARLSLHWTIAVLAIPVLFSVTFLRATEWDNYLDFTYYEAHHHPDSPRAVYSLGQMYAILALQGAIKDQTLALNTLSRAASLSSGIMPDVAMMIMSAKLKSPVNPAWATHAEKVLRAEPLSTQDVSSLNSLVNCLPTNCKALAPTAGNLIQTAFHTIKHQQMPRASADLWVIYANYLAFTDAPFRDSLAAMEQSVKHEPNIPRYRISLTKGLIAAGMFESAEDQIQTLSRLNKFGILDLDIQSLNTSLSATRSAVAKQQHPAKK